MVCNIVNMNCGYLLFVVLGSPSAFIFPEFIESLDLRSGKFLKEIWFLVTATNSYSVAVKTISQYIHDRNQPKDLHCKQYLDLKRNVDNSIIDRETIVDRGGICFTLDNFLSEEECNTLIKVTNNMGYRSVSWEYDPNYRRCTRIGNTYF